MESKREDIDLIKRVQRYLGVSPDGIFGSITKAAVIKFQIRNSLVADGIIGKETLTKMRLLDSDLTYKGILRVKDLIIHEYFLPNSEYLSIPNDGYVNEYLFLHHTGGWDNPYHTVDYWAKDLLGPIGTEFVIGGINPLTNNNVYDGKIIKAFPDKCQAFHLGSNSKYMNLHSVGIEICGFGQLDNNYKAYCGVTIPEKYVTKLTEDHKGYFNFHKYSDKQLYELKKLILYISSRDNIDIREGLIKWINNEGIKKAFDYHEDADKGNVKGLLTHGNVRKTDRLDVLPQSELIDMLLTI